MASGRQKWQQMSPATRGLVVTFAAIDVGLRVWSLVDLARRPAADVRGPKPAWAAGLALVNSGGILPGSYLLWGRHAND